MRTARDGAATPRRSGAGVRGSSASDADPGQSVSSSALPTGREKTIIRSLKKFQGDTGCIEVESKNAGERLRRAEGSGAAGKIKE